MPSSRSKPESQASPESLSAEAVYTRICTLEAQHDLLQYEVDGWCVWPLLRFRVAMDLNPLITGQRSMGYAQRLELALQDLVGLLKLRRARYVVKTYPSGLVEREGARYKDVWFDDLLRSIGSFCKIETINSPIFLPRRKAALIKASLTSTLFELTAGLLALLGSYLHISGTARRLSACLQSEFGLSHFTPRWVESRLRYFHWMRILYGWLLGRLRPEYVLTADFGEYALAAAAKGRGITVVELQHGLADRSHPAYSWTEYAVPYKARMPIPDRLFVFGEHWRSELDACGFWGDSICATGNARLDHYRQQQAAVDTESCTIVLTSQGIDVGAIIAFVKDFLELATEKLSFHLYIKLHPVYEPSKERYEQVFGDDARVSILLSTENPSTFELLRVARFHLSISSTCHYDALGLGAFTVILPFTTHDVVAPLHEAGHAFLVSSPDELLDVILQWKDKRLPDDVGSYYFKANAIENIKRELGVS